MAEDFGDALGASAFGALKKAAVTAAKSAVCPVSLATEAKDMMAASKALEASGSTPALARTAEKAVLTR